MKMTAFEIGSPDTFLHLVDQCGGDVTLELDGGTRRDLKRDCGARELVRRDPLMPGGLHVAFSDQKDAVTFMGYLMGMHRAS